MHLRFHFVKETMLDGSTDIGYCPTNIMVVNALTRVCTPLLNNIFDERYRYNNAISICIKECCRH